jgi:hypothetical protein
VRAGREPTAEILTTLRVLLCYEVVFDRKYCALHFYKAELERELARLMNGYTGCTGYSAKLFYLYVYDFNYACSRSDGIKYLSYGFSEFAGQFTSVSIYQKSATPFFSPPVALRPNTGYGLLILEVST